MEVCDFGLARLHGLPQKPYTKAVVTLWSAPSLPWCSETRHLKSVLSTLHVLSLSSVACGIFSDLVRVFELVVVPVLVVVCACLRVELLLSVRGSSVLGCRFRV